jgi:hypothetical protein
MTLVLAALLSLGQDAPRIEDLIKQLGSEEFAAREKASEELRKIGKPAEEALKKAAGSEDPEVRARAKSILEDLEKPEKPKAPAARPPAAPRGPLVPGLGLRGTSVQVRSVNGDSTYVLTPGEGSPITFHKSAAGTVKLEYKDADGKSQTAEAESLEKFLKDHKDLAAAHGITEEGIDFGGARVSFKGAALPGLGFRRPLRPVEPPAAETPKADFEPASDALRAQLGLAADEGVVVARDDAAPGLRKNDVLVEIDGRKVSRPSEVRERIGKDSVLVVLRKGKRETLSPPRKDY